MSKPYIEILGRKIGEGEPPYIIAEISANHNGNIKTALNLISEAKDAGADAVKLQTYTPDTITIDHDSDDFLIKGGLWDGRNLYDLYEEAHTPYEWHKELFAHARSLDLHIFSSPFDDSAVDLLEELNTPAYKIASFEAIDIALIRRVAATKKPLIISTGMANLQEIEMAVKTAKSAGCTQLALLHCVSAYPAPADQYNLRTIADLAEKFDCVVGLSDHTFGITVPVAAITMGASIVEKHFTDKRANGGPDSAFSLEPAELKQMCEGCKTAFSAIGKANYDRTASEKGNVKFRRSLYVVKDIAKGENFNSQNIRSIRPGFGLPPQRIDDVLGKKAALDIKRGTALSDKLIME